MQLKTFNAPDVSTALALIKEELGPDAVIISTRETGGRKGLGLFKRGGVEITAAIDADTAPSRVIPTTRLATKAYNRTRSDVVELNSSPATAVLKEATKEESSPRESVLFYVRPLREEIRTLSDCVASMRSEMDCNGKPVSNVTDISRMRGELSELRHMMGQMAESRREPLVANLPEPLRAITMRLADSGVKIEIIREGLERLGRDLTPGQLDDQKFVNECVLSELKRHISVSSTLKSSDRRAQVVSLVGPTGVGKTTTVAKLAGQHIAANRDSRVALMTLDTFRVGAINHLKIFGDMLGLPVHVAKSASELDTLIRRHLDHDLILIDSAGGNQKDTALLEELRVLIGANPLIETHLCVSATTKGRDLRDILDRFAPLAIEKLIFTKTDETNSGGSLYNFLTHSGKPLAYVTNGQHIPSDIEVAEKDAFCRWVLGD